ncbi:hypothetical protein DYL72_15910 [Vibrio anguillarum]|uniref:Uncharacterized protein n=1 Tax=Vibrio anguillarum TaxID=55601 RepID=A0A7U6FS52_VIBAN|nr:hypothetical protein [Vibrio anguillarum]AZS26235.1 hypothetical protein DYL72_15110 [Vibrio anguillarum]AZS26388.1 hypothetical protein DYL72_15910 [Vibrio anguillarum]
MKTVTEIKLSIGGERMAKKCIQTIDMADIFNWKLGHGGKREGSGRKKSEGSEVIRVPSQLVPQVKKMIEEYKNNIDQSKKKAARDGGQSKPKRRGRAL